MGALCALLSIVWAPQHAYWACCALIVAAFFDTIDGRIARALGAQSPIGAQLDSLVDLTAFGVAPAILLHQVAFESLGSLGNVPVGVVPMFAFVACAALRLALFNGKEQDPLVFRGIPSPTAALWLVTAVMTKHEAGWTFFAERRSLLVLTFAAALLMIAPISFPSYKRFKTRWGKYVFFGAIGGGLTMLLLGLPGGTVLFVCLSLYVLRGLGSSLLSLGRG